MEILIKETRPLCQYFLSGYLAANESDSDNFPPDQYPDFLDRYEELFRSSLASLRLTQKDLKAIPEFDFNSGNANNLESGIAVLRAITALRDMGFGQIKLVKPKKRSLGADLYAEKNRERVCFEVKTITKKSKGRKGCFLEEQIFEKIKDCWQRARSQLAATTEQLRCTVRIMICVVNWFTHSVCLDQSSYQGIVNQLAAEDGGGDISGIDGVLFILSTGCWYFFVNERGRSIDNIPQANPPHGKDSSHQN